MATTIIQWGVHGLILCSLRAFSNQTEKWFEKFSNQSKKNGLIRFILLLES